MKLEQKLNQNSQHYNIYPEYYYTVKNYNDDLVEMYFDLLVCDSSTGDSTIFEFKYKTIEEDIKIHNNIDYKLKEQGAVALGSFDIWKDIERMEYCIEQDTSKIIKQGFLIFITNDGKYYDAKTPMGKDTNYTCFKDFYVKADTYYKGNKTIDPNVSENSAGKIRKKHILRTSVEGQILITNDYDFEYNVFGTKNNSKFRSLVIEIK